MSRIALLALRAAGWKVEGAPPTVPKFVLIAAPHTSNWDAVLMLLASDVFGVDIEFFIKDAWFRGPLGPIMRRLGGVPIDRSGSHGVVDKAIQRFNESERLILAVPPEGTRGKSPHWRSGFYHIAFGAKVPIVLGYLDYGRKVAGLGPAFTPTGDIEKDFEVFRAFYAGVRGKFPDQAGAVVPPPRSSTAK